MLNINEKIGFWSSIMRDHADFFLMNLSSKEVDFINKTKHFKEEFSEINNLSTGSITNEFISRIISLISNFIDYKRLVIQRLLTCDIEISLPPSFINHMINEAVEFYKDLEDAKSNKSISLILENINLHKIWLADASGHASSIAAFLDPTEKEEIKIADKFAEDFNNLLIKVNELGIMLERTELDNGALKFLNEQVKMKISDFIYFLSNIRELTTHCELLGVVKPIYPDHMIREEQYYLSNIQRFKAE
jgi:hypothetical protein